MMTLNDGRSELWQWDTKRKLTVDAECSQVHFSNKVFGRSIDMDVVDGVAIIPDVLLQTDKDLNVWAFVGTAENGYTKISKTFKVNRRNKPADYVFTPTEQTTIAEIAAIAQSVRDDADSGLFDGKPGVNGRDGVDGKDGAPGTDGRDGADGYTPVYGTDYGTAEQISEIAQQAAEILQPEVEQLKDDIDIQGNSIALNRYKSDFIIEKSNGVTLTRGTKGEIIFSGTATGLTYFTMDRWNGEFDGKVIFHTGVKGTLESYFAYVQEADENLSDRWSSDWRIIGVDYGDGICYTESHEKYYQMIIKILGGTNVDGVVMYPMLEMGSTANDYIGSLDIVNVMGSKKLYPEFRVNEFLHNINNALYEINKRCLISKDSVINKESAKVIKGLKNINPNRLYYVNGDITEDDFEGLPVYKRIGILSALSPFVNAATQNLGKIYIYAIAEKMWYKMHLYDDVWGDWVEIAAPKVYDIRYTKYYKPSILFEPGISYDWVDSSGNHDDFTVETTSEEYFAKLNALADSWYELKKENLGKDASGEFDIYGYRLHCFEPPIAGGMFQHKPKIIITGCHHGFEKAGAFSLYYLMKHLKNDWRTNKTLEYLRYACDICFIPIVNTWGFTNYVEGDGTENDNPVTRLNSNGVDLNRGYNSDSLQPEQIIVKSFTSRYKDDAILFVDYHTNGSTRTEPKRSVKNWISLLTYGEKTLEDISIYDQSVIGRHFSSTYGNGSDQNWGAITQGSGEGLASWLGDSMNIPSLTLEGTFYVDNDTEDHEFNPTVNKFNTECLINFLGLALKKYSDLY